ncbi:MAG TPA: DnaJ domain-containing protein [Candidatus Dormibacteraeota bacterium]|nr:DnaJ domain-containing protein [Candidatus Dormibacteraeota bacterium]
MQPRLFPYAPERDVYRLLEVEPSAEPEEIVAAIRRLARTFHPDRNDSPRATEEMQVVYAVRNLLIDPQSRARYDHARHRFLAEGAALRSRSTAGSPRGGVKLRGRITRGRPIASRIAVTGRTMLAVFRAILDAFAPARGRLLTTNADAVPQPPPEVKAASVAAPAPQPVATEPVAPPPVAMPAVSWEADGEVVLDPQPAAGEAAPMPVPASAVAWDLDGEVVLEPVPIALPPMMPLPIRPLTEAIPVGEPRKELVAAGRRTVLPHRSNGAEVTGSFWETSARAVAAAPSEIAVQECAKCGLVLSASARFCRRCGTSQARSA